jgi:hypothetical protein
MTLSSCDRLKRKGHDTFDKTKEVVSETKQKINRKASDFLDSVILKPSVDTPNTERDKRCFREYLLTEIPEDVKMIYSYGDFFGADYKVLISFTCNPSTIDKIVASKKMDLTTKKDDGGLNFMAEFPWWDKEKIRLLKPYKVGKEYEYWKYLWFDPKTKQAYYEEFSL